MRRCLFLTLVLALALPAVASAQQTKVWIDCRHGEAMCAIKGQLADFVAAVQDAGATEVVVSTELPSNVGDGDFRLLVMVLPTLGLSTPELNIYIPGFLAAGGRLVLLAENSSEPAFNANVQAILNTIPDHGLSLGSDDDWPSCTVTPTTDIAGDPLTAGLSSWHFARTNSVSGGDPLIRYDAPDGSTKVLGAVSRLPTGGEVLLFGDTEGFVMNCEEVEAVDWATDHRAFWMNLYSDGSSSPDADGDGFNADEDCNDDDPYVNPNADEICDNAYDDDCDGLEDGDDPECAGDDDDASDDDDAFDDDDTTPFDGGGGGGWGDNAGCCGTDDAAGEQSLAGSFAVVLLLGLLGLGRRRI